MASDELDKVDKGILYLLQQNARSNTTESIGQKVGVSSSTVANRISGLEERGVITGYHPSVDYMKAGLDHHLLAIGTVPLQDIDATSEQILGVSGVVSVRELLINSQNVAIELVGHSKEYVERIVANLNDVGVEIDRMEIIRRERTQPFDEFGKEYTSEE